MAQTSKQKQAIRRAKRRATTAERCVRFLTDVAPKLEEQLQALQKENYMVKVLLFASMAQHGGSVEVTKGTFEQTIQAFPRLSVTNRLKDGDEKTYVLTLVETPEPLEEVKKHSDIEIVHIPDEVEPFPGSTDEGCSV